MSDNHPSKRPRTRSPHNQHKSRRSHQVTDGQISLPFNSRQLTKRDYDLFKPIFASYLDIQKKKFLEDLDEHETKGRWKSFIGKWNRAELSEGWYDPVTLQRAIEVSREDLPSKKQESEGPSRSRPIAPASKVEADNENETSSDDEMGPALPGQEHSSKRKRMAGPSIPNMQDLELKRELDTEDKLAQQEDLRWARKEDRKAQKASLDELVPRAEPGSRERQLEKKAEVNAKMASFRERSPGAAEVPDSDLMGGGDGLAELKKLKEAGERKMSEREARKEEFQRARKEELNERLREYREKEEATMQNLHALARARFG